MRFRSRLLVAVATGVMATGVVAPGIWAETDPAYPVTSLADLLAGSMDDFADPNMAATEPGSGDNPYFMPDWNGNGVYGEQADIELEHQDDPVTARFRYPCIGMDGVVTYRTVDDSCAASDEPGAQLRTGEIRKVSIVDSRGFRLAARLLLPEAAEPGVKLPAAVFSDGANYAQSSFYAYGMSLAAEGMIVLHYDQAGQGDSEGTGQQTYNAPAAGVCPSGWRNFCLDIQDAVRWFAGQEITPITTGGRNPAYAPEGENVPNPVLDMVDTRRIGIIGQSAGSVATTVYLRYLADGAGSDGRPLPPVAAAVGLSGFGPSAAIVPIQVQSADYDIPGVTADNFGAGVSDGPAGTHAWYEDLRASGVGDGALEELIIESGSHGDTSNVTHVPHAVWALSVSTGYATDWFTCYLQADEDGCASSRTPRPHLSRIQASEYDIDGPAGAAPSRCLTIPDQVSLGSITNPLQAAQTLAGMQNYDCTP